MCRFVSESALRLRFLPRNPRSNQAKRHKHVLPAKLVRPGTSLTSGHQDSLFCRKFISATCFSLSLIPEFAAAISLDDKSRVYLGRVPIATQRRVVMGLERVRLPNHSFQIAPRHSLVPSVYMALKIREDMPGRAEAVSKSGPLQIYVRSGEFLVLSCFRSYFCISFVKSEFLWRFELKFRTCASIFLKHGVPDFSLP